MKTIFLFFALFLSVSSTLLGSNIEVRFASQPSSSVDRLAVKVEVRNTSNTKIVLADQNYRLYYDSEKMSFDDKNSTSSLASDTYSELNLFEHFSHISPVDRTHEMGFINFSILLQDLINGGVQLPADSKWLSVATLYFDMTDHDIDDHEFIWSRTGVTDDYATAFVHMTEWIAPKVVQSLVIDYYHDASIADLKSTLDYVNVSIGPNPASDYIIIDLEKASSQPMSVRLTDMSGRVMKSTRIERGEVSLMIDISGLSSSSYIIDIYNQDNQITHSDKIIVALP